jgi:ankyrin repeat protein
MGWLVRDAIICCVQRGVSQGCGGIAQAQSAVNARGFVDWVPLQGASLLGHLEVSRVLLEFGADVNVKNPSSLTPLYLALENGHAGVATLLIEYGADPNSQNEHGGTLLHLASQRGDSNVARWLLELDANVHVWDYQGRTPFQVVSGERWQCDRIAQLLLYRDAGRT